MTQEEINRKIANTRRRDFFGRFLKFDISKGKLCRDRKNNRIGYILSNLKYLEFKENMQLAVRGRQGNHAK
jgi:hypothetical protein